jgi:hypothetical protein
LDLKEGKCYNENAMAEKTSETIGHKKLQRKHFTLKEVRLSIAHMVLWSLLSIAFFTYLTIELGEIIDKSPLYFIVLLAIYAIVVVILTLFFTHRFIGPFARLKTELRIILSGNHHKRLTVRHHDDIYIGSFIKEVNMLVDKLEKMYFLKEDFHKKIAPELSEIKSLAESPDVSREDLKQAIVSFNDKVEGFLRDRAKR